MLREHDEKTAAAAAVATWSSGLPCSSLVLLSGVGVSALLRLAGEILPGLMDTGAEEGSHDGRREWDM
jgi:hypothetical protein